MPKIINGYRQNILEECTDDVWSADEGSSGEDAEIIVDIGCPKKLEEIQILNGIGDFSSKGFSVLGASGSNGPWKRIYKGELKEGKDEV